VLRVDLAAPSTFGALAGFDAVVNASDSVKAPPDALASWCLDNSLVLFEMAADLPTAERLLDLRDEDASGHVVVGVGVFPGLSTALATATWRAAGEPDGIELGVRVSPLSGAGGGTVELMTATLATPSVSWSAGQRVTGPSVGSNCRMPFLGTGEAVATVVPLPDAALIARATGAANVRASMSLVPAMLRYNFRFLAALMTRVGPLRPALAWMLTASMRLLRGVLLRRRESGVQLTATAADVCWMLAFDDGQEATAFGAASAVSAWLAGEMPAPGVYSSGQVLSLERWLEAYRAVGGMVEETRETG
jgi:hypothetical protein